VINLATISRVHNAKANFICGAFASRRQRSISTPARPVSADARTKAWPSNRPNHRAGTAPAIHILSTGSAQERGDSFRAFAPLHLPHCAFAHRFRRLMIQSARIIFSHAQNESFNTCVVTKKSTYLCTD
jgi:hypothetical protein